MSSKLYTKYLKCIEETDKQMSKYHSNALNAQKLQGAIAVELLKQEIDTYLETNNKPLKTSAINFPSVAKSGEPVVIFSVSFPVKE